MHKKEMAVQMVDKRNAWAGWRLKGERKFLGLMLGTERRGEAIGEGEEGEGLVMIQEKIERAVGKVKSMTGGSRQEKIWEVPTEIIEMATKDETDS